jgi:hypothetical protein
MSSHPALHSVPRARWPELARRFLDYNYQQTWAYVRSIARRNHAVAEHVSITSGRQLLGLVSVRIRSVPFLGAGIAYIRGGPLVRTERVSPDRTAMRLARCLQALRAEYVQRRGLTLRILPPAGTARWNALQHEVFAAEGFPPTNRAAPYRTIMVDLSPSPARIRAALRQKWRNCLNRAERNSPVIRAGTDIGFYDLFRSLFDELRHGKRFTTHLDASFYRTVHQNLDDDERLWISLAFVQGRPAAGHVSSLLGDTCVYLLGAANDIGRRTMASYLLQWHAINTARARGCRWYDLGGIDPLANPGVYHFKRGLPGPQITAPGPFESRPHGPMSLVASGAERLYRSVTAFRHA